MSDKTIEEKAKERHITWINTFWKSTKWEVWQTNNPNAWGNGSKTGWKVCSHNGLTSSLMPYAGWRLRGVFMVTNIKKFSL